MDEVEEAEGPLFLSMSPVRDSEKTALSNMDLSHNSATPAFRRQAQRL
jgi:hypothetical protein